MTAIQIHPQASAELEAEITHYENARRGWGSLLREDVLSTIRQIAVFPRLGRPGSLGSRRFVTPRFLFLVHYDFTADQILVLAISHPSREPGYWQSRRAP
jgi:plasmid stabilization system protein ParE